MPRPVVLGNGSLLVAFDEGYRIRDLCYPHVGLENHLCGHAVRTGIWVHGQMSWLDEDSWSRTGRYEPGTLTAHWALESSRLPISIETEETVHPELPVYVRRMLVGSTTAISLEVRAFFNQYLTISESDIGDCAFYHPGLGGMVHHKGDRYFLFGGKTSQDGLAGFNTGLRGFGGHEGTWRDAEDGELDGKPIEQGSVDSTFALQTLAAPKGQAEIQFWIVCGTSLEDLEGNFNRFREQGLGRVLTASAAHWLTWSDPVAQRLDRLPEDIAAFARQSALILKTQIDIDGGILAANDSDIMQTNRANYSYVWPRDGALVAEVLDSLGLHEDAARYFRFCSKLLTPARPFFLQKYRPDGGLGASWHPWIVNGDAETPLQEDETALTLHALAQHWDVRRDHALLHELYEPLVVPCADFLVDYRSRGLPLPSYDLWEERRGVHTFTCLAVAAGLRGAAQLALAMGDDRTMGYAVAADEVIAACRLHLVDPHQGVFYRGLKEVSRGQWEPDATTDASLLLALLLDVIEPEDELAQRTAAWVRDSLWVRTEVGGIARYPGDYYFRRSESYPGNPWIICTLWLAQWHALNGNREEAMGGLRWAMRHASETGVLPEQLHPETGEHLSVSPLTWSHAEFLKTAVMAAELSAR